MDKFKTILRWVLFVPAIFVCFSAVILLSDFVLYIMRLQAGADSLTFSQLWVLLIFGAVQGWASVYAGIEIAPSHKVIAGYTAGAIAFILSLLQAIPTYMLHGWSFQAVVLVIACITCLVAALFSAIHYQKNGSV